MQKARLTIDEIKARTVPIAQRHGVASMFLFGSYARNEASPTSDVDICVEKGKIQGLIQYYSFVHDLERALQCHVDVITTGIEDQDFLNEIKKNMVLLYEQ